MFCAPGLIFGGTVGVGSRFHVLPSRTRFRRYQGRRVPFSCFALSNMFLGVTRASGAFFMFCAPELIFVGTEGVGFRFHLLCARPRFRRHRGRRVPFSCFALPDSFSSAPRELGPVFIFCAPDLVFDGAEGVWSRFHVLRARNHFRRYRWRRVPFSCFASPDSFLAVPRASRPVFIFYAPGLIFGGVGGVGSRFNVLRARNHFRRYRVRRVPFSCFARPNSFSAVPLASGPFYMFCTL
jgi:hypothetical protein